MHISTYDTEDPCEIGNQTTYVVVARNEGTSPATNVIVKNQIPEQMEFVSAEPRPQKIIGKRIFFEPVDILKVGEKLTYKIVCKAVRVGSAKNTAILKFDQFEKEILDEEGTSLYK